MNKGIILVAILLNIVGFSVYAQNERQPEALGLPGDNLNLYAVLDVFQKSKTLEDFERVLNDKDSNINNLDLNNDKYIDYIKVVSEQKSNTHFIILQVPVTKTETQDVAVIQVSKEPSGNVSVQIIGDVELYGKDYIVEPSDLTAGTPNPGYRGDQGVAVSNGGNYAPVMGWPVVVYLYSPVYVVYRSPFYWDFYPHYWHPWAPVFYYNYWGFHHHYFENPYYHRTVVIRDYGYYRNYSNRRNTSMVVTHYRNEGSYNATYEGRSYRKPDAVAPRSENPRNNNGNTPRPTPVRSDSPRNNSINPRTNPIRSDSPRNNSGNPRASQPVRSDSPRNSSSQNPRPTQPVRSDSPRNNPINASPRSESPRNGGMNQAPRNSPSSAPSRDQGRPNMSSPRGNVGDRPQREQRGEVGGSGRRN